MHRNSDLHLSYSLVTFPCQYLNMVNHITLRKLYCVLFACYQNKTRGTWLSGDYYQSPSFGFE